MSYNRSLARLLERWPEHAEAMNVKTDSVIGHGEQAMVYHHKHDSTKVVRVSYEPAPCATKLLGKALKHFVVIHEVGSKVFGGDGELHYQVMDRMPARTGNDLNFGDWETDAIAKELKTHGLQHVDLWYVNLMRDASGVLRGIDPGGLFPLDDANDGLP